MRIFVPLLALVLALATPLGAEDVAPSQAAAAAPETIIPAGPVVSKVRELLKAPNAGKRIAKDDLAAALTFYNQRGEPLWIARDAVSPKAKAFASEIKKAADYGLDPKAFDLPDVAAAPSNEDQKADVEFRLTLAALTYARHARGGRIRPESVSRLINQSPPLKDPKTILNEIAASREPDKVLRGLHPKHQQFERLRQELLKARSSGSPDKDIKRLLINMERWRWMPEDLGKFHVMNNIPAFMSRTVKDGKTVFEEKIIVGQTNWPTPVFSADMKTVVFNPAWGMPDGIKAKELQPRLRKAGGGGFFEQLFGGSSGGSRVLEAYKLKVTRNGRPVNPDSIDWSTADLSQFHFSQPAGGDNPLGKVKFMFPNDHDVYMHDTNQRDLFSKSERALSHGCMRLQNPKRFSEILLAEDKGWTEDKIAGYYRSGGEVSLDKPVPVHVVYLTAVVNGEGNLETFGDLYGLDSRMSSQLFGVAARFDKETDGGKGSTPATASTLEDESPAAKPLKKSKKKITVLAKPQKPSHPLSGDISSVINGSNAR